MYCIIYTFICVRIYSIFFVIFSVVLVTPKNRYYINLFKQSYKFCRRVSVVKHLNTPHVSPLPSSTPSKIKKKTRLDLIHMALMHMQETFKKKIYTNENVYRKMSVPSIESFPTIIIIMRLIFKASFYGILHIEG